MLFVLYFLLMLTDGRCADDPILETKTIRVGDPVTLTCSRRSAGSITWMRVVSGNSPEVLTETLNKNPHITVTQNPGILELKIRKAKQSDTAVYICMRIYDKYQEVLKVTYLRTEEPVTTVPPSVPVRPEDSVTLKCWTLHESQNESCPADDNVFCFTAESNQCHPSFNYTKEDKGNEYENNSTGVTMKKCFYSYLKNFSSSDAWMYHCAVAPCEEKVMGNKSTKLNTEVNLCNSKDKSSTILYLLCAALAMSGILIAFLVYTIKKLEKKSKWYSNASVALQTQTSTRENQETQQMDEDSLVYSAPVFTRTKVSKTGSRGTKSAEEETIYTNVSDLGL
ncbi:uncharacterized protein PAE49_014507 isoform 2-T2 [Odontesthes bonariensis]|uniref:uncharacterized protein LOC142397379 n=1 Tax=Odontesthes bonariensis TaxID=219752 RepID=UPI003F58FBD5